MNRVGTYSPPGMVGGTEKSPGKLRQDTVLLKARGEELETGVQSMKE